MHSLFAFGQKPWIGDAPKQLYPCIYFLLCKVLIFQHIKMFLLIEHGVVPSAALENKATLTDICRLPSESPSFRRHGKLEFPYFSWSLILRQVVTSEGIYSPSPTSDGASSIAPLQLRTQAFAYPIDMRSPSTTGKRTAGSYGNSDWHVIDKRKKSFLEKVFKRCWAKSGQSCENLAWFAWEISMYCE